MAEEEKNEQQQEEQAPAPEETPAEEPQAEEGPAAEESGDEAPKEVETPAGEADSEEAGEESAEAEEASSDEAEADEAEEEAEAGAGPDEMEGLDWKARRRLERSRQPAEPGPQQSSQERAAARSEARKRAASRRAAYRAKGRTKREGAGTGTPPAERRSAGRKSRQGRVVSSKPDKTITVQIEVARRHPQYEKIVRRSRTLHVHDARNEAGEGDLVRVVETRPLSRTKRWRLVEILEKAK
jgi:small subunit ribosomal protein S17